ncbi:helix-turn-helix domain-containing protein, partial [Vibrio harveyi]|uniref:helix-turn-helix domain-containing protein n=1 Tax=Vibrio harveyi TaxID=669 RepID=UPI002ADF5D03
MLFGNYFGNQINSYGISQADLVRKLHTVHPILAHLDTITLNRWLNNKTTPPKDKQIVIARFFERDLKNYISQVAPPSI